MATFDASPCLNAKLEDLEVDYIRDKYLPEIIDEETLAHDDRDIASLIKTGKLAREGSDKDGKWIVL